VAVTAGGASAVAVTGPTIVLATAGRVTVATGADAVELAPGRAAYVGADEREVTLTGAGEVFVAQPGTV
jgi:mannose-6-phosphate isomerase